MQITPSEKNLNLGEYYDLHVQNDTLLLADVLYYLMELQNLSMMFSHLYTHAYFLHHQMSILKTLNISREYSHNISELFLHPSVFLSADSRSA